VDNAAGDATPQPAPPSRLATDVDRYQNRGKITGFRGFLDPRCIIDTGEHLVLSPHIRGADVRQRLRKAGAPGGPALGSGVSGLSVPGIDTRRDGGLAFLDVVLEGCKTFFLVLVAGAKSMQCPRCRARKGTYAALGKGHESSECYRHRHHAFDRTRPTYLWSRPHSSWRAGRQQVDPARRRPDIPVAGSSARPATSASSNSHTIVSVSAEDVALVRAVTSYDRMVAVRRDGTRALPGGILLAVDGLDRLTMWPLCASIVLANAWSTSRRGIRAAVERLVVGRRCGR
jgi:hypothetical protein